MKPPYLLQAAFTTSSTCNNFMTKRCLLTFIASRTQTLISQGPWSIYTGPSLLAGIGLTGIKIMLTEFSSVSSGTAACKVIKSIITCSSIHTGVGETVVLQITGVTLKSCIKAKR